MEDENSFHKTENKEGTSEKKEEYELAKIDNMEVNYIFEELKVCLRLNSQLCDIRKI